MVPVVNDIALAVEARERPGEAHFKRGNGVTGRAVRAVTQ